MPRKKEKPIIVKKVEKLVVKKEKPKDDSVLKGGPTFKY